MALQDLLADILGHVTRMTQGQWTTAAFTLASLKGQPTRMGLPFRAWQHLHVRVKDCRSGERLPPHLKLLKKLLEERRALQLACPGPEPPTKRLRVKTTPAVADRMVLEAAPEVALEPAVPDVAPPAPPTAP
eukprot:4589959-Amphidinium_carterae.1